jgi:hypothetical protein
VGSLRVQLPLPFFFQPKVGNVLGTKVRRELLEEAQAGLAAGLFHVFLHAQAHG